VILPSTTSGKTNGDNFGECDGVLGSSLNLLTKLVCWISSQTVGLGNSEGVPKQWMQQTDYEHQL
jgi:hypothetical protein